MLEEGDRDACSLRTRAPVFSLSFVPQGAQGAGTVKMAPGARVRMK